MSFTAFIERHTRTIIVLALALAVAGGVAGLSLPVGLFPQVSFPRVVVDLNAGSRPADQTALLVTRPVEEAIRTVPGVRDVRSETTRGSAQISVDFGWGRDMVAGTLLVDAAIAQVLPSLPAGTAYDVRRMDPTVFPIISYALMPPNHAASANSTQAAIALRDLAQYQIVPLLSSIQGLARVDVQGGETAEVEVLADPHRLAAYGLGLNDLVTALAAGNVLQAVGRVQDRDKLYLVVADHSVSRAAGIANTILRSDPTGVVRVRDVATVRDGVVPQWIRVVEDGRPAVLFNVYEQPDGNAVQIAGAVRNKLAGFKLPPGVQLVKWYDQSELVTRSATSVRDADPDRPRACRGRPGVVLCAVGAITLIAVLTVPATLAAAVLVLQLLGISFNIMTLGGSPPLSASLIDDVIVMIEHIARRAGAPRQDGTTPARERFWVLARSEFMQPADRVEPGDADRLSAAGFPQRCHRRVLQGAVGHDGGGAGHLLSDDGLRGAGAGAQYHRLQPLARPGRGGRWLAEPPAWTAARRLVPAPLDPWRRAGSAAGPRLVRLQRRADRLHAVGRRGWVRDGLLHQTGHLAD